MNTLPATAVTATRNFGSTFGSMSLAYGTTDADGRSGDAGEMVTLAVAAVGFEAMRFPLPSLATMITASVSAPNTPICVNVPAMPDTAPTGAAGSGIDTSVVNAPAADSVPASKCDQQFVASVAEHATFPATKL